MKIRVAIVLPYFSNGGAQMMIARLASHLDLNIVDPKVICIYGIAQHNQMEQAILEHNVPICYIGKKKGFSVGAIQALNRELDQFQPDLIHTHLSAGVYCADWAIKHRVKILHTVHNMPQYELIWPKRMVMRMLYRFHLAVPVAISSEIRKMLYTFYPVRGNVELIYNPVDVGRFAAVQKKTHDEIVLVTAGRLSKQKNQSLLIDAFAQLADENRVLHLYLLGDGSQRLELQLQIDRSGLTGQVHLEGNVENVEDYFAKADIFVLSSRYEGLPLAVLEAMAASLPIVSTDVGGVRDIVTNNGILVREGSVTQLRDALALLIKNENLRRVMGMCSFQSVQRFDSNVIAKQYCDLYRKYAKVMGSDKS